MVVFVDLDDDPEPPRFASRRNDAPVPWIEGRMALHPTGTRTSTREQAMNDATAKLAERSNPNRNALTAALGCYPIISVIASSIDLNTLDNLSRSCRQTRENLLQFRRQLITKTLRCCNEDVIPNSDHTLRYRARAADWYFVEEGGANMTGKVGSCARDLVSECRRCARVVCRNCTIKPPAPILLRHRHRRLCPACIRAPLACLVAPHTLISSTSPPSTKPLAIKGFLCTCPNEGVWLCQPCGRSLRSADTTYESIWRWRERYGPTLGGLGTGFGEGNRSFECGRGAECLAARQVEEAIDCDAEDARESDATRGNDAVLHSDGSHMNGGRTGDRAAASLSQANPTPPHGESNTAMGSGQMGPGYARHEIEGIGGGIKKKLVRMVWVGACVTEWEDEKEQAKYLVREVEGKTRSWCGWCWRVIPGVMDAVE